MAYGNTGEILLGLKFFGTPCGGWPLVCRNLEMTWNLTAVRETSGNC